MITTITVWERRWRWRRWW